MCCAFSCIAPEKDYSSFVAHLSADLITCGRGRVRCAIFVMASPSDLTDVGDQLAQAIASRHYVPLKDLMKPNVALHRGKMT